MNFERVATRIAEIYPWEDPDTQDLVIAATEARKKLNEIIEQLSQFRLLELKEVTKYANPANKNALNNAYTIFFSSTNKLDQILQNCGGK
jgi:hypothetical protein